MCVPWIEIYEFLNEWQTLLGALIALAAAIWTICVMRRHTINEETRHKNHMHRKEMAARAQMPDALSDLCKYIRSAGECLVGRSTELPDEPTSAISTLKNVIEHIDDSAAHRTFELVSWFQVQRVRLVEGGHSLDEPQRSDRFYDVVLLQAYANSLFEYARNEEPTAPTENPSREEMKTACNNAFTLRYVVGHKQIFEDLNDIIERRHENIKAT